MSESAKKAILIVVIVVAAVFIFMGGKNLIGGEQPQVIQTIPGDPSKSMKRREMEAQQAGTAVGAAPADRDLGDLPVKGGG